MLQTVQRFVQVERQSVGAIRHGVCECMSFCTAQVMFKIVLYGGISLLVARILLSRLLRVMVR